MSKRNFMALLFLLEGMGAAFAVPQSVCTMPVGTYVGGAGGDVFLSTLSNSFGRNISVSVKWPTTAVKGSFNANIRDSYYVTNTGTVNDVATSVADGTIEPVVVNPTGAVQVGVTTLLTGPCWGSIAFKISNDTVTTFTCGPGGQCTSNGSKSLLGTLATYQYTVSQGGAVVTLVEQGNLGLTSAFPIRLERQ